MHFWEWLTNAWSLAFLVTGTALFVGITLWVYSPWRRSRYEEWSKLPLSNEQD